MRKKKHRYGNRFKKDFLKIKTGRNFYLQQIINNTRINTIKISYLRRKIIKLPHDIQKKIYILTIKKYWKDNFLNNSLMPIWYHYKTYMDKQLGKCYFENIHFMHLECNILPELKKWIPGCQCVFCKKEINKNINEKRIVLSKINNDPYNIEFCKSINCYDSVSNRWNMKYEWDDINNCLYHMRIFDPLFTGDIDIIDINIH
jgi:hypothetical protein